MNYTMSQVGNAYAEAAEAWTRSQAAEEAVRAEQEDLKIDKFLHVTSLTGVIRQAMDGLAQATMIYIWRDNEGNHAILEAARVETVRVTEEANALLDTYGY